MIFCCRTTTRSTSGCLPVEQYVARNNLQIDAGVQREIVRIQRVRQITQATTP